MVQASITHKFQYEEKILTYNPGFSEFSKKPHPEFDFFSPKSYTIDMNLQNKVFSNIGPAIKIVTEVTDRQTNKGPTTLK